MTAPTKAAAMPAASKPRRGKSVKAAGDQGAAPLAVSVPPAVQLIGLALLDDNPANPRDQIGDVGELADSIRSVGLLEPLIVAPAHLHRIAAGEADVVDDGRYIVIAGHRRKAACATAPLDPVPCIVRGDLVGGRDEDAMLIENLHREDLTALEEARGYQRLVDRGLSQRDIADRVGRNQSHISKRLSLLKLPDVVQQAVLAEKVTLDEARALIPLADDEGRLLDVLERRPTYQSVEQAVARHVDEIERSTKVAQLISQLKREGKTYVKNPPYDARMVYLPGDARKGHESKPCHGFTIPSWGEPELLPICTKPAEHRLDETNAHAEKARKERAKQEKAAAAKNVQRDERVAVAQSTLSKSSKALEEFAVATMLAAWLEDYFEPEVVLTLLGEPVDEASDPDVLIDQLRAFAEKGHSYRLRMLGALAIGVAEDALRTTWRSERDRIIAGYEQLLTGAGWSKPKDAAW